MLRRELTATFKCKRTTFTPSLPNFLFPLFLSLSLYLTPHHSVSLYPSLRLLSLPLSPRVSDSIYIQKQHIPLRLHKVALQPPPPLCVSLFLHSSILLIPPSILHLSLLILLCKGFPPSTYISAAVTTAPSLLLSPLVFFLYPPLPCHFPPFFALILCLGSSSSAPPAFGLSLLSFVSHISPPFFLSSLSSLLMYLSSYTFLSLVLDFPLSSLSVLYPPVACWSMVQVVRPSLRTKSAEGTNIADVICPHVSASLCPCLCGSQMCKVINSLKEEEEGQERLLTLTAYRTPHIFLIYLEQMCTDMYPGFILSNLNHDKIKECELMHAIVFYQANS